jgi:hypothetical protein
MMDWFGFAEGTFKTDKILQFLDHNKFPLVIKLTELNSARVYSSPVKLQVLIFPILYFPCFLLCFRYFR